MCLFCSVSTASQTRNQGIVIYLQLYFLKFFFLNDCVSDILVFVSGSEETCSKIGESKVSRSTSNRTMVNYILLFLHFIYLIC
jgi:hypothetical protein